MTAAMKKLCKDDSSVLLIDYLVLMLKRVYSLKWKCCFSLQFLKQFQSSISKVAIFHRELKSQELNLNRQINSQVLYNCVWSLYNILRLLFCNNNAIVQSYIKFSHQRFCVLCICCCASVISHHLKKWSEQIFWTDHITL